MNSSEHSPRRTSHPFRWFPEFLSFGRRRMRAQGRLLACSLVVGVVAGLGGIVFTAAGQLVAGVTLEGPAGYHPPGPRAEVRFPWIPEWDGTLNLALLVVLPVVGGLLSGGLVFRFAPEAEGHGTDAAIAAYHEHGGYIRPRVPLIKLVASALTIGTGGSGGREGPIAQIGAGFGSVLGGILKLRAADRRVLVAAGMGAGVAAIFRAPLAGALFAAEILYCSPEFEPEVILPAGLASVTSYCTFGVAAQALGGTSDPWRPLFETPASLVFTSAWELLPYTLLAFVVVVLSMIYVRTFYAVTDAFHHLPLPRSLRPAVGAGLTGLVGVGLYLATGRQAAALSVMSYGYGVLQEGLLSESALPAGLLLAVACGKIVTTSLTIGSGGSGGVFGPSMVIGGCGGASGRSSTGSGLGWRRTRGPLSSSAWPGSSPRRPRPPSRRS
ncbi:MAG: chloride channel protein [Isosphaeraceae bacterium]